MPFSCSKILVIKITKGFWGLRCGFALRRYVWQRAVRSTLPPYGLGLRLRCTAAHRSADPVG